jgi:MSHA pilin protein MshC
MKYRSPKLSQQRKPGLPGNGRAMSGHRQGFTTTELLIVLVLVGVLAFIAIPRLNVPSLKVAPVAEQVAAEIRYAQNLAMTRSVAHSFMVGGGSYSISNAGGSVPLSNGEAAGSYDDVTVDAVTVTFSPRFGRPDGGSSIAVSAGSSVATIVVEGETGYVYIVE